MFTLLIKDSTLIPDWLKENIEEKCPYCGEMYHVGYSPNGLRVTKHYCPNKECPGTLAMKMVFMWNILNVSGIKFGKSMELIKRYNIKKHMHAIPYVLEDKPKLDLTTFMRINCIQGIDSTWDRICYSKNSLDEVVESPAARPYLSTQDIEDIKEASNYVEILYPEKQEYEPVVRMTIMMTGDIMNLPNREYLVVALNQKYKGLLDLRYSKSKRKTGISVLVKEANSPVTGKVNTAIECGIPIMTPQEFVVYVDKLIKERAGGKI